MDLTAGGTDVRQFGELEAEIMDRLWEWNRPTAVREVLEDLQQTRTLAYTTVMTVMDTLHTKGWLTRERDGRAYLYQPSAPREEYAARLISQALDGSDDRVATLVHFFDQMTPSEARQLRAALADRPARKGRRR